MTPVAGLEVRYKNHIGKIRHVDTNYATICIREFSERNRDVCILVYQNNYKDMILLKESER